MDSRCPISRARAANPNNTVKARAATTAIDPESSLIRFLHVVFMI
jgi:hypothetical protein